VRYFLDTEYNGWHGGLLALALVPEDHGEEFYVTVECLEPVQPWVQQNVLPYLDMVPRNMLSARLGRVEAARALSAWLIGESRSQIGGPSGAGDVLEILADWPEDIAQICGLLTYGPGLMVDIPPVRFELIHLPGFSTAANSRIPHNALHDARALRDHVLAME
jgi:hypothetical protein